MTDTSAAGNEQWVVWNGSLGILVMATLGRIEAGATGRSAWLAPPYDVVGPFSLDELEAQGRIAFEACIVMSRQRWQEDQVELRRAGRDRRRADQESLHRRNTPVRDEREHRETLHLPLEGQLKPSQIKAAYRRLAQKAHPDTGGSHEQFIRITEARNALLGRA